jgi:hypothetical protein
MLGVKYAYMKIRTTSVNLLFIGLDNFIRDGYVFIAKEIFGDVSIVQSLSDYGTLCNNKNTIVICGYVDYISVCIHNFVFNSGALFSFIIDEGNTSGDYVKRTHDDIRKIMSSMFYTHSKNKSCPFCSVMSKLTNVEKMYLNNFINMNCEPSQMKDILMRRFNLDRYRYSYMKQRILNKVGLRSEFLLFVFCGKLKSQRSEFLHEYMSASID